MTIMMFLMIGSVVTITMIEKRYVQRGSAYHN